jgi:hypothetical protein
MFYSKREKSTCQEIVQTLTADHAQKPPFLPMTPCLLLLKLHLHECNPNLHLLRFQTLSLCIALKTLDAAMVKGVSKVVQALYGDVQDVEEKSEPKLAADNKTPEAKLFIKILRESPL